MKSKLTFLILSLMLLPCVYSAAQDISVSSFELAQGDLDANLPETTVLDQNGQKCALIKIFTTQTGFTFDVGSLGVVKTESRTAQIWVYVPHGVRKISIFHQTLGSLVDYYFDAVESAKTYHMRLTTGEVKTVVVQKSYMDYLTISVEPKTANVYVNGELLSVYDGYASKLLPFGTYNYRIEADRYHSVSGKVVIDGKKQLNFSLKPAFGYLSIPNVEILEDAKILVDGKLYYSKDLTKLELSSGEHTVNVQKPLYCPFTQKIKIVDNQVTTVNPSMVADYSVISINAGPGVKIYINGQYYGVDKWSGKLQSGAYKIEARKEHYKTSVKELIVKRQTDSRIITIDPLEPIYGSVNITSSPMNAEVLIDGTSVGNTPLYLQDQILEGKHIVQIKKQGHHTNEQTIVVKEGQTTSVSAKLVNSAFLTLSFPQYDSSVKLFIDGIPQDRVFVRKELSLGEHVIFVEESERFEKYTRTVDLEQDTRVVINLVEKKSYRQKLIRQYNATVRAQRRAERAPFKLGAGFTLISASWSSKTDYSSSAEKKPGNYGLDLFFTLGSVRNTFNFHFGGGYTYSDFFSGNTLPVFFRINWNISHKKCNGGDYNLCPYISVEAKRYFGIGGMDGWGVPIRIGLDMFHIRFDLFFEPMWSASLSTTTHIGLSMSFAFDQRVKSR